MALPVRLPWAGLRSRRGSQSSRYHGRAPDRLCAFKGRLRPRDSLGFSQRLFQGEPDATTFVGLAEGVLGKEKRPGFTRPFHLSSNKAGS